MRYVSGQGRYRGWGFVSGQVDGVQGTEGTYQDPPVDVCGPRIPGSGDRRDKDGDKPHLRFRGLRLRRHKHTITCRGCLKGIKWVPPWIGQPCWGLGKTRTMSDPIGVRTWVGCRDSRTHPETGRAVTRSGVGRPTTEETTGVVGPHMDGPKRAGPDSTHSGPEGSVGTGGWGPLKGLRELVETPRCREVVLLAAA